MDVTRGITSTLRARGNHPPIVLGVDQYNFKTYKDIEPTIGVNCGVSTGRNSVLHSKRLKTFAEKRFFEWHEDDKSVTLRNSSGSYGGGSEVLVIRSSTRKR